MQVIITCALVCLLEVSLVASKAQYDLSGYRPPGPRFELPQRQYGSPSLSAGSSLPTIPATSFRSDNDQRLNNYNDNIFEQRNSNSKPEQNYPNQDVFVRSNAQYGAPFTPNIRLGIHESSSQRGQSIGNSYGAPEVQGRYLAVDNRESIGLARQVDTISNNKQYNYNRKTYEVPNRQNQATDFSRDVDDEDTVGISNQNYLPPTTTEGLKGKTTENSNKEPIDSQEDFGGGPNVAISTSFAKGRYYLVQPSNNLQRLIYSNGQLQGLAKNNEYRARLIYQNLAPLYSYNGYNTPTLIRLY